MGKEKNYESTVRACFVAYIVQAIVNNFAPLLFLTFKSEFGIPLSKITLLITINFLLQLMIDLVSPKFVDRIGYRASMVLAHFTAALGLLMLAVLPSAMPDAFAGILIAVMIYAVGGGLLEVVVSPVVEACPTKNKEMAMSLLHSFYCWGQVGVVLLSTVFFALFGTAHWRILAILWALVPALNLLAFLKVPMATLIEEGETPARFRDLAGNGLFWVFMVMMLCAGASEQTVSQWASAFAEEGLGVAKSVGDLLGPMLFAICMGTSRAVFGKFGDRMNLSRFMAGSAVLCVISYLLVGLSPSPVLAFAGCALCGLSVGIFWPGTFSLASAGIRNGGTLMFALFALAGDLGCSGGPTFAGAVASALGDDLQKGIFAGVVFPLVMLLALLLKKRKKS